MNTSVVLFTSDLRLHDHPPLREQRSRPPTRWCRCSSGTPPWTARASPRPTGPPSSRTASPTSTRACGGAAGGSSSAPATPWRRSSATARRTGAGDVHVAAGHSQFARDREERLARALRADGRRLHVHDGVVTAGARRGGHPGGSDHFAVFTPYHRRWTREAVRAPLAAPGRSGCPPAYGPTTSRPGRPSTPCRRASPPAARRRPPPADAVARPARRRVRGAARRPRGRRDLPALAVPPLRRGVGGGGGAPGPGAGRSTARRRSYGSCAGGTSTTRCCTPAPTRPAPTTGRGATAGAGALRRRRTCAPGGRDAPAIPWSTPPCGSSPARAGCTTGADCSPRPS